MKSFGMTSATALLLLSCSAWATVYTVPGDAATIQDAIYLCVDGDSVVIGLGTYIGAGNRDITLSGRKITVRSTDPNDGATVSNTVIDCENSGRGFVFDTGETAESVVAGLTIINGNGGAGSLMGGALYFAPDTSPVVSNCVIVDSSAGLGGAIAVLGGSPTIRNCRILGNTGFAGGGALYISGGSALFENCVISGNSAPRGGAVYSHNVGDPVLVHCTITTNTATTYAGAINCFNGNNLTLYGCILWDNTASIGSQMYIGGIGMAATVNVSYCDMQGIDTDVVVYPPSVVNWGLGNIEADPLFIEAGYIYDLGAYVEGDFGLMEESPCVDTGDPNYVAEEGATDVYGAQRLFGEAIDIGAAEFVIEEIEIIEIEAKIKFRPKAIKLRGKQKWLFCTIKLKEHEAEDIDADSIVLEETIMPKREKKPKRGKHLKVRFDMDEIRELIDDSQKTITLTVQGTLKNGAPFAGVHKLKIRRPKGKHAK